MSDELVYKILIELAVLEGKRKPTGEWLVNDPQELPRLLKRARQIVNRVAIGEEEFAPRLVASGTTKQVKAGAPARP